MIRRQREMTSEARRRSPTSGTHIISEWVHEEEEEEEDEEATI